MDWNYSGVIIMAKRTRSFMAGITQASACYAGLIAVVALTPSAHAYMGSTGTPSAAEFASFDVMDGRDDAIAASGNAVLAGNLFDAPSRARSETDNSGRAALDNSGGRSSRTSEFGLGIAPPRRFRFDSVGSLGSGSFQVFRFEASAGEQIRASVVWANSSADVRLFLFDESFALVDQDTDGAGTGVGAISALAQTGGQWAVGVQVIDREPVNYTVFVNTANQTAGTNPDPGASPNPPPVAGVTSPPFSDALSIDPDIVNASDLSSFSFLTFEGTAERQMFDRRAGFIVINPFIFLARYDDGLEIEIQVNPEFNIIDAGIEARRYAELFGQLPTLLRRDVDTSWIHRGVFPWGGGNRNILIHTGQSEDFFARGVVEEALILASSQTSLNPAFGTTQSWRNAQQADPTFISAIARDNPDQEDITESFLAYVAVRYRRDRISGEAAAAIEAAIPNRLAFFDSIVGDMFPFE